MAERRRGPLSKSEKFYIDSQIKILSIEVIADDIHRTVPQINKYLETLSDKRKDEITKVKNATEKSRMEKMMSLENKEHIEGVTILTEGASEYSDLRRKEQTSLETKYKNNIHKIK